MEDNQKRVNKHENRIDLSFEQAVERLLARRGKDVAKLDQSFARKGKKAVRRSPS
jgi:hypothetical protein